MARYPDGIGGERIFQKNVPGLLPRLDNPGGGGEGRAASRARSICDKPATLVYLANQACIELHAFLSKTGELECPDQLVFDLDPPGAGPLRRRGTARAAAAWLLEDELELTAYVKTTGGKGLHVHVPLRASRRLRRGRGGSRARPRAARRRDPGPAHHGSSAGRAAATGSTLDIMRNAYAQTAVAPYSVRGRPGAPVATPLRWEELEDRDLSRGGSRCAASATGWSGSAPPTRGRG